MPKTLRPARVQLSKSLQDVRRPGHEASLPSWEGQYCLLGGSQHRPVSLGTSAENSKHNLSYTQKNDRRQHARLSSYRSFSYYLEAVCSPRASVASTPDSTS